MCTLAPILRLYKQGNVSVSGLRGTGKDMLTANVIARRKQPYISNFNYECRSAVHIPLDLSRLNIKNNYDNLISGDIVPYDYPYPDSVDIYLSDAGVYFPSQYNGQLDKKYEQLPMFQALSRQLGDCNFHYNAQNLNRVWLKIREQSDIYIRCLECKVFGRFVFQDVIIYDKFESCQNRVMPYRHIRPPLLANSQVRAEYSSRNEVLYRQFLETHGTVTRRLLVYWNKSKYDTRYFKRLLGGKK